ncbi:hypothetical protein Pla123a_25070 [Posidoniimonas polymericola]|uniref:Uncharacterized protein n=2 Tax=Posidoniimonas polymericola TaxID=2528002 RepID=A0A5C5YQP8_9BACT|nr:hypothetical protein Pla123a_25070 [Posidoniimonas polymericola]
MWYVESYELRDVTFDYTSSSLGMFATKALHSNGVCLVNNIDRAGVDEDPSQVLVCDCCGFPGCESGGYISIRRVGNYVVWIPAFTKMLEGAWKSSQYTPPGYLTETKYGIPVFEWATFDSLRKTLDTLPTIESIPSLMACEAVRVLQWCAPFSMLGKFPDPPQLRADAILAVTDGDLARECDVVQRHLNENANSTFELEPVSTIAPIEFHLDVPKYTSWSPLVRYNDGRLAFNLDTIGAYANQP